jgi:hypothetical protein
MAAPPYNPNFDVGESAFGRYWSTFLGERQRINTDIMKERLAQTDPTQLFMLERSLVDNITRLSSQLSNLQANVEQSARARMRGSSDVTRALISALGSVESAETSSQGSIVRAEIDQTGNIKSAIIDDYSGRNAAYDKTKGGVSEAVRGLKPGSKEQVSARVRSLIDAQDAGADPVKKIAIVEAAMEHFAGDPEAQQGAFAALGSSLTGGRTYADIAEIKEDYVGSIDEEKMDRLAEEFRSKRGVSGDLMASLPKWLQDSVQEAVTAAAPGVEAGAEVSGSADPSTEARKKYIEDLIKRNEVRLSDVRKRINEASEGRDSAYSDFYKNAATETLMRLPERSTRNITEALGSLSESQRKELDSILGEAGGDARKAYELLSGRMSQATPEGAAAEEPVDGEPAAALPGTVTQEPAEQDVEFQPSTGFELSRQEPEATDDDILSGGVTGSGQPPVDNVAEAYERIVKPKPAPTAGSSQNKHSASAAPSITPADKAKIYSRLYNMPGSEAAFYGYTVPGDTDNFVAEARRSAQWDPDLNILADYAETGEYTPDVERVIKKVKMLSGEQ